MEWRKEWRLEMATNKEQGKYKDYIPYDKSGVSYDTKSLDISLCFITF